LRKRTEEFTAFAERAETAQPLTGRSCDVQHSGIRDHRIVAIVSNHRCDGGDNDNTGHKYPSPLWVDFVAEVGDYGRPSD
jgi:hypothetical protein